MVGPSPRPFRDGPRILPRILGRFAAALLILPVGASAQPVSRMAGVHHTAWIAGQDLPTVGVQDVRRTPDGYLWLGSSAGLLRFDGLRFTVMDGEVVPALRSEIPGVPLPVLSDRAGTLWVSLPDGGLARYREGRFAVAAPPGLLPDRASQMVQDSSGQIWILAGGRLFLWRDESLAEAELPPGAPDRDLTGIVPSPSGLWLGTRTWGLWHLDEDGMRLQPRPHDPDVLYVRPELHDARGRLWVGGDRLRVLADGTWTEFDPTDRLSGANEIVEGADGSIWIASNGSGVLRWQDGAVEEFSTERGLTHNSPSGILVDVEGSTWVTSDAGLDRLRPAAFTTLGPEGGLPIDSPLLGVGDEKGGIWVMDFARRVVHLDGGLVRPGSGPLRTREWDAASDIPFAAADGGGVWTFRLHSDRITRVRNGTTSSVLPSPALAWTSPRRGVVDASGTLWVGASAGGLGRVRGMAYDPVVLPGFGPAPPVGSLAASEHGRTWVALAGTPRLFALDGDSVVGIYGPQSGIREPLLNLTVQGRDTLWASTGSGTLMRIVRGQASPIREAALQAALIHGPAALIPDGTHLWIGTAGGIGRVPLAALHVAADGRREPPTPRWFGPADGLPVGRTSRHDVQLGFRAADGRVWFVTPVGLAVVDPGAVPTNVVPPTPRVEGAWVAGSEPVVAAGSEVAPNPGRMEFRFSAGSLRMPEGVRVEYRLDGTDPGWIPALDARTASYTRLRPGHHRFRVRARNEDGVAGLAEATFEFRILPAWYQTWWFAALSLLAVAGAGAGTVGAWIHAVNRAEARRIRERYEAALSERARVAQEIHDTLLQGFLGVTLHLQAVAGSVERAPREAARSLQRVLAMADRALREGRQVVWNMRPPELEEGDLPATLEAAARWAVGEMPVEFAFETRGTPRPLPPELETTVLRVGREAVTNAIRHGHPGAISMVLTYEPDSLRLHVHDNGHGFRPESVEVAEGNGHFGLRSMRERALALGGSVQLRSSKAQGTTVELNLPTTPLGPEDGEAMGLPTRPSPPSPQDRRGRTSPPWRPPPPPTPRA